MGFSADRFRTVSEEKGEDTDPLEDRFRTVSSPEDRFRTVEEDSSLKEYGKGLLKSIPNSFAPLIRKDAEILSSLPKPLRYAAVAAIPGGALGLLSKKFRGLVSDDDALLEHAQAGEEFWAPKSKAEEWGGLTGNVIAPAKYAIPGALGADILASSSDQYNRARAKGSGVVRSVASIIPNAMIQYVGAKFGQASGAKVAQILETPGVKLADIARVIAAESGKNVGVAELQAVVNNVSERVSGADTTRGVLEGSGKAIAAQTAQEVLGTLMNKGRFTRKIANVKEATQKAEASIVDAEYQRLTQDYEARTADTRQKIAELQGKITKKSGARSVLDNQHLGIEERKLEKETLLYNARVKAMKESGIVKPAPYKSDAFGWELPEHNPTTAEQLAALDLPNKKLSPIRDLIIRATRRADLSPQYKEARDPLDKLMQFRDLFVSEHSTVRGLAENLPEKERDIISVLMAKGREKARPFTPEQAKDIGLSDDGYKAYRAFVEDYRQQMLQRRDEAADLYRRTGDKDARNTALESNKILRENDEFVPASRYGKLSISFTAPDKDGKPVTVAMVTGDDRADVLAKAAVLKASRPNLAQARQHPIGVFDKGGRHIDSDVVGGFNPHLTHADLIPGAEMDFVRAHHEYTRNLAGSLGKLKYGKAIDANISTLDKMFKSKDLTTDQVKFAGEDPEEYKAGAHQASRALAEEWSFLLKGGVNPNIRQAGSGVTQMLLGGDIGQLLIQPVQLASHGSPTFSAYYGRGEGAKALNRGMKIGVKLQAKRFSDFLTQSDAEPWGILNEKDVSGFTPKGMTDADFLVETRDVLQKAHDVGTFQDVAETVNMSRSPEPTRSGADRMGRDVSTALMMPMSIGEYTNRTSTFMGAYLEGRRRGLSLDDAYREAHDMSNRINNVSGDTNLSRMHTIPGLGGLLTIPSRLRGFAPQYLSLMEKNFLVSKERLIKEGKSPVAAAIGASYGPVSSLALISMLSGYKAVPMITDVWEMLRDALGTVNATEKDLPSIDAIIEEQGAKMNLPEPVRLAARMGVPALLGVDVSGRLGFNRIIGWNASKKTSENLINLGVGASGTQLDRMDMLGEGLAKDDPGKVSQAILPRGLFNAAQAADGAVSVGGAPTDLSTFEKAVKFGGFQPTRISNEQFKESWSRDLLASRAKKRRMYINQMLRIMNAGGETKPVLDEIRAFNEEMRKGGHTMSILPIESINRGITATKNARLKVEERAAKIDNMVSLWQLTGEAEDDEEPEE
jgi:hypothetical protein